jgi:hypothetical protein
MQLINYTPHAVTVRRMGPDIVYPASGVVPRVEMTSVEAGPLKDGCPTSTVCYGLAELPPDHPPICIVSTMFADRFRSARPHDPVILLVPDSGPSAIRRDGQIVAVRSLIRR